MSVDSIVFWTPPPYPGLPSTRQTSTPILITGQPLANGRNPFPQRGYSAMLALEITIEVLIMTASFVGNLLVLISIFQIRGLRNKKTNLLFVLALTLADMMVICFVMPFHIVQNAIGRWPFGRIFCDVFVGNDIFFCTASLLGIMCIAVERYIAVFKPLRYNQLMTSRRSIYIVVASWIVSLFVSHLPVHLHFHLKTHGATVAQLNEDDYCKFEANPAYALASSAISYWIPCLVMGFVYLRIYFGAKRQLDQLCQAAPALVPSVWPLQVEGKDAMGQVQESSATSAESQKLTATVPEKPSKTGQCKRKDGVTLRTKVLLGRILGCFILCWSPFFTLLLLDSIGAFDLFLKDSLQGDLTFSLLSKVALWLAYSNSLANPFIYAMSNHEISKLWRDWRRKHGAGSMMFRSIPLQGRTNNNENNNANNINIQHQNIRRHFSIL